MQKIYKPDTRLKKDLIKRMKRKSSGKLLVYRILSTVLYVVIFSVYIVYTVNYAIRGIECLQKNYTEDFWGIMIGELFFFCLLMIFNLVPGTIRRLGDKKVMWKWNGRKEESVKIKDKSIYWYFYDRYDGNSFWEYRLNYSDITEIIYDSSEELLFVHGYMSGIEWQNSDMQKKYETIEIDRNATAIPWMTIPAYYEGFDDLVATLEQVSGREIIRR
jgi:hypothetical protein